METHNNYNKNLKQYARQNRNAATKAEACLWKFALKSKQTGYAFNRQRSVLNYIADFMCQELKLIIEVDGYTHTLESVIKNDCVRQTKLEETGFTLLRFTDAEVLMDIGWVKEVILKKINELKRESSSPLPSLRTTSPGEG